MIIRLKYKVFLIYLIFGLIVILLTTIIISPFLNKIHFKTIEREIKTQQIHIDLALTTFIKSVQVNAKILSMNRLVQTKDHRKFTNFLNANSAAFRYNFTKKEVLIRKLFNHFRIANPYINSVYMGRENGSFVRSHKRAKPTKYDPRTRPWYKLAKNNPNKVMKTNPYRSITTRDVNIGIVKALINNQNKVYGVVGIDVTLKDLTKYMSKVRLVRDGYMMLLDKKGIILVGENNHEKFTHIRNKIKKYNNIFNSNSGNFLFNRNNKDYYCFHYSSKILGWKVLSVIPTNNIIDEINQILYTLFSVFIASLIFLSILTLFGLNKYILHPLSQISIATKDITKTKNFNLQIKIKNKDELGDLASSFNLMTKSLKEYDDLLKMDQKRIEEALLEAENANRFKDELFSILSHEIRTPLTGIIGFSELIYTSEDIDEATRDNAEKILYSSKRLSEFLINLIEMSNLEVNRKDEIKIEEIILDKLIEDILEMLNFRIDENENQLSINIKCNKEIYSDYFKLKLVLYNIISNAVKFTKQGKIDIEIEKLEKVYQFKISDEGIGIKKEHLNLIFELFKQVDNSSLTRQYQGLGAGLTVCKKLVNILKGKIWVESEYGKGSTFYFNIPVQN